MNLGRDHLPSHTHLVGWSYSHRLPLMTEEELSPVLTVWRKSGRRRRKERERNTRK